jgi:hypothetical protein
MIFVVGARRSGTLWLQRILGAHPHVASVPSESHLFSHGIAPLFELFQHSLRSSTTTGRVYVERGVALDGARDLCDAVFGGFLDPGTDRLVERTPLHVLHLDLISEIYPDAQVVHIVRDGRDVALSVAAQNWGPSGIKDAAAEWRSSIRAAREAGLPESSYRETRYEALLQDPGAAIVELYSWLGLPADDETVRAAVAESQVATNLGSNPSGTGVAKWRDAYSASDLAAFEQVAGDLLDELGYPRQAPREPRVARDGDVRGRPGLLTAFARRVARRARRSDRGYEQPLVDEAVGAIRESDIDRLRTLMAGNALVRIVAPAGTRSGRGDKGLELVSDALSGVPLGGRQVRGDAFPGAPYAGVVLGFEDGEGGAHVVLFLRVRDAHVSDLIVYVLSAA